jgi:hypothetical protein
MKITVSMEIDAEDAGHLIAFAHLLSDWEEAIDNQMDDVLKAFCYATDHLVGIENKEIEMKCSEQQANRYKKLLEKLR